MKYRNSIPMIGAALLAASFAAPGVFGARAAEASRPVGLQGVMQQLGRDVQAVAGAISIEDWSTVARLAPMIARHPEPPLGEKVRILAWLGSDAGRFRKFDGQVHDAAMAMGAAAERQDGDGVIAAFANTQRSCLACHQNFRERFVEHFHRED